MSEFEQFVHNWYFENVNLFTLETGMLSELIRELDLQGITKRLFLRACNLIYQFQKSIEKEMIEKEIEKQKREAKNG